ncbi:hypothetical protein P3342_006423 [Pyrenophora teres f. teres]|nr:hypothetical protein P3342_006423 [Pyrenophora teres f. teres]
MADTGVDLASLTPDQQAALQQYTAVTDQAIPEAIPILQRAQWNVNIAVTRFFDGEPAEDPVAAAAAAQPPPQDIRRQETLLNGFATPRSSTSSGRRVRIESAPRVVPQPESQVSTQVPLVLAVLFAPVSLLYSVVSKGFRLLGWLFPFLARAWGRVTASNINTPASQRSASGRRPLNPRDTAARFIREFEEEYGSHNLPFFESGYAQAFDLAKKNLQFLMVVLVSPEHDETTSFVRDTLLAPEVVEFIRNPDNNIILWAGNVQDSEAYQVSAALSCLLNSHGNRDARSRTHATTTVHRKVTAGDAATHRALESRTKPARRTTSHAEYPGAANSAYERSLAADREKARKKKEEAERKAREEKEALEREQAIERYAQNLAQWRKWRAASIRPEPGAEEKDIVRISLRMPNADRVVRKFAANAHIEELYAFVECYDVLQSEDAGNADVKEPENFDHEYKFQLVSPMPREIYELKAGGTIKERIGRSGNLIVERTDLEEDEDAEDEE